MRWFDRIFTYLFPLSLLESTPWFDIWREKERSEFIAIAQLFFPVAAAVYLAHFWLFDRPMGLEPASHWLTFRLVMVAISLLTFAYYLSPLRNCGQYRLVAMATCAIFSVSQSRVTVWYPDAPYLYCFVFVVLTTLVLRMSVVKSCVYALVVIAMQWPALLEINLPTPLAISAAVVSLAAIVFVRGSYLAEIRYFLLNQQNIDTQRKNIELNIEFTDRLKSFIPRQIASRLERHLQDKDTTVLHAIYEVLKPQKREIACLFSDIRGFTEGSKELDAFIRESVLPNVKACTDAIESNNGIPRKIGDLIFAYFDDRSVHLNLVRAVMAGLEVARINEDQNISKANAEIQRYILISTGEAIVGNIGGFDSSVEITALGTPVNFLSRLDELTKHPELRRRLFSSDLVMCDQSVNLLHEVGIHPQVTAIDLCHLGLSIRNFPDHTTVHAMRPTEHNRNLLRDFHKKLVKAGSTGNDNRSAAA